MSSRNLVAVAVTIALAWVASGCGIEVAEQSSTQLGAIGDVRVTTTFCTDSDHVDLAGGCSGHAEAHPAAQAIVGYAIPEGSGSPNVLVSSGDVILTYERDAEYTDLLNAGEARDGLEWVAYSSEPRDWERGESLRWTVAPAFSPPSAGAPYEGPFRYASVASYRQEGVRCATVDDCPFTQLHEGSQPTRDLAIESGPSPAIAQNDEGDVPLTMRLAGAPGEDVRFDLSATTDLPGGIAGPREATFAAASAESRVHVRVQVPGDAEPGLHTVTLTARAGEEVRSGTTEFMVTEKADPEVAIESSASEQLDVIGDVRIDAGICTKAEPEVILAFAPADECGSTRTRQTVQGLVAFRVPVESAAPATLEVGGDRPGDYVIDQAYGEHMDGHAPPPPGQRWVGYRSVAHTTPAGVSEHWDVSARFALPTPGRPYEGPYPFAVAAGYRDLAGGRDAAAPVDCAAPRVACGEPEVVAEQATRDLAVVPAGDPPRIVSGTSGTVPFELRFAGAAGGGAEFDLSATTGLPGAGAAVDGARPVAAAGSAHEAAVPGRFVPEADSARDVGVRVDVPAGSAPGVYALDLTAAVADRADPQRRRGRMRFEVVAPEQPPPVDAPVVGPPPPAVGLPLVRPTPRRRLQPRPRLALSLVAAPRRAYTGDRARYRLVARNQSPRATARGTRVCQRLPGRVQYAAASRRVTFVGRSLCFGAGTLRPGKRAGARIRVLVNRDARPGTARARAVVSAANARSARARASLQVVRRAQAPRPAPVTG